MNKFIFLDIDGVMNSNLFYSERTLDRELLLRKLASLKIKGVISIEEYEYLKHLIRKENENAQRANGCTY